jgi:hypothetical protein
MQDKSASRDIKSMQISSFQASYNSVGTKFGIAYVNNESQSVSYIQVVEVTPPTKQVGWLQTRCIRELFPRVLCVLCALCHVVVIMRKKP